MPEPTLVLTTVDTEEAWDWSGPFPTAGYSVEHVKRLPEFQAVCERHGMRPTYFVDHAVMASPETCLTVRQLALRPGVEVGMHIHPWNTPPLEPQRPVDPRETYLHNHPPETIRAKLESVYASFLEAGLRPRSFRGGRYSSGGAIHEFLRRTGFVADCSIVPFTRWDDDGAPDHSAEGPMPRRIAPGPGAAEALWEIPLSLGFTRGPCAGWARIFRRIEYGPLGRLRLIGIAGRLGLVRRVWLNFELGDVRDWIGFMKRLRGMGVPVVTLTVHSSSLFAGPGPYTRDAADERRMLERVERVLGEIAALEGFAPATASEAADRLERDHRRTSPEDA